MTTLLKNIIRFVVFIFLQAYVLDKIPSVHQLAKPSLYFLFILWLPFKMHRSALMLVAFIFGLTMDYFSGTPGLHAAPCVLIAYFRPFLLAVLLPKETNDFSYLEPSVKSLGAAPYSVYLLILTFLHHTLLVLIEWIQFGDFWFFIGKVTATTAVSLLLIFITELLFNRNPKYRTNTA